ncbi:nitroreductase family protein [Alkalicaulis satelles]|uniref:Nitroreductase family protein n=1 Tax=Alkalicaulis satelles TaxID=2609175 RepID=A0A5M6ZS55_9PROT|nr:nitroreductase family protein [Alkalicaulis satelles]KAA5805131.1 nitroreductase family protein [Alkalicaulis satelles]
MSAPEMVPLAFEVLPEAEMQARAQAFHEAMRTRRTIRDFSDRPVPRAIIETAILTAGTAPNGANHQPWHFTVLGRGPLRTRLREAAEAEERAFYAGKAGAEWLEALAPLGTDASKPFLETAPWIIAVFGQKRGGPKPGDDRKNYYVTESVGIACGLLLASLHQAGLATLTHTPNPMGFLSEICERPASEKPVMLIVTGYPAPDAAYPVHAARKKLLEEISDFR